MFMHYLLISGVRVNPPTLRAAVSQRAEGTHIVHGVQQLGELEEALPGLARVVGCLSHRAPQLLNVINPHFLERRLVLQTLFRNWKRDRLCQPLD